MQDTNYKLRGWMGSNKVSHRRMAELLEMPYETFRAKIAGESQWKLSEVIRILDVTGCLFEEIF